MSSWQHNSRSVQTCTPPRSPPLFLYPLRAAVKKQSFNLNNQSAVTNQTFHLRRRRRRLDNQSILFLSCIILSLSLTLYIHFFSFSLFLLCVCVCVHSSSSCFTLLFLSVACTYNSRIGITFPHQPSVISPPSLYAYWGGGQARAAILNRDDEIVSAD